MLKAKQLYYMLISLFAERVLIEFYPWLQYFGWAVNNADAALLKDHRTILFLVVSEYERINEVLFPLKS